MNSSQAFSLDVSDILLVRTEVERDIAKLDARYRNFGWTLYAGDTSATPDVALDGTQTVPFDDTIDPPDVDTTPVEQANASPVGPALPAVAIDQPAEVCAAEALAEAMLILPPQPLAPRASNDIGNTGASSVAALVNSTGPSSMSTLADAASSVPDALSGDGGPPPMMHQQLAMFMPPKGKAHAKRPPPGLLVEFYERKRARRN